MCEYVMYVLSTGCIILAAVAGAGLQRGVRDRYLVSMASLVTPLDPHHLQPPAPFRRRVRVRRARSRREADGGRQEASHIYTHQESRASNEPLRGFHNNGEGPYIGPFPFWFEIATSVFTFKNLLRGKQVRHDQ